jgi:hypothetical protein
MTEKKKRPWNHRSNPPSPIPENLRTPDGREFSVEELLRQTNRDRQSHSLINNRIRHTQAESGSVPARGRRYTPDAKLWIANTPDLVEIARRFRLDVKYARKLQHQFRRQLTEQHVISRVD